MSTTVEERLDTLVVVDTSVIASFADQAAASFVGQAIASS